MQLFSKCGGGEIVKIERSVGKLSQNVLFSNFPKNFINEGILGPKLCN